MKTLLFATGETKKLVPLTDRIVSPLLPILNRPVMDYMLEVVGKQGIKQIDISLHNRPDEIEAYFGDGQQRGLKLAYHLQREAWGDGGALRWAYPTPEEPVLLLPADILIDMDLEAFQTFHETHRADVTVLVAPASAEGKPGLSFNIMDERIVGIESVQPEGQAQGYVPTGAYLVSPDIIQQIPPRKQCDILNDLIPSLIRQGCAVYACVFSGFWNLIDSFKQYQAAQIALCLIDQSAESHDAAPEIKYLSRQGRQVSEGIWIGRNNAIHPSVQMAPLVYLDDNCRIEKDVVIGPDVIIGRNVVIDSEATLSNAVILDHTYVGRMLNVQSKIVFKNLVIDISSGEHIIIKDAFLLAETEDEHVDIEIRRFVSSVIALILFILLLPLFIPVGLFLAVTGSSILKYQECMHTDFRWFVPVSERRLRSFKLLQLQLRRKKDGAYIPLGRLLEAIQLYRYPELINVIKGDIAFIGVNPLPAETVSQLSEEWQRTRFSVPAGLTGLWFLQADEKASLDQILIADAYYAATRNIKMDLNILFRLPGAWLKQIL